jgi:hypothetical protein
MFRGIREFTDKIVRIGGQSKCHALEPYSLKEHKKRASRYDVSHNIRQFIYETHSNMQYYHKYLYK